MITRVALSGAVALAMGFCAPAARSQSAEAEPTGLWQRANLLGDIGGLRSAAADHGISFGLTDTEEVLGNPTGGFHQGATYEAETEMSLGIDLGKAIGLRGGIFNVSALQIRGRGLSTFNIGNLMTVSSIEDEPSTRLFELWYQQSLFAGKADIRIGQLAADQEFMISQYATVFINSSFGWPTLPATDLPAGGPAEPFATPAVRLRLRPTAATTVLLGVFNGNPAGPGTGDPQQRDPSGTVFSLNGGVFVIAELQVGINQRENAAGLPGMYKIGGWYNSNAFANQSIGDGPPPPGVPGAFVGNWSVYAVADQLVYRPAGAKSGGLGVFARAMGAPGDRNQVAVFVDGGLTWTGVFGREGDTVGLGVGWTWISRRAAAADAAAGLPVRTAETVVELTYQAQVAGWWQIQPDFQYVFNPSGGVLSPTGNGRTIGSAAVLGLRSVVTF